SHFNSFRTGFHVFEHGKSDQTCRLSLYPRSKIKRPAEFLQIFGKAAQKIRSVALIDSLGLFACNPLAVKVKPDLAP
ncbi:MAG: hypothetical protein RLO18_06650, partial [Gimesia chilikensis]